LALTRSLSCPLQSAGGAAFVRAAGGAAGALGLHPKQTPPVSRVIQETTHSPIRFFIHQHVTLPFLYEKVPLFPNGHSSGAPGERQALWDYIRSKLHE
jgi:hypothetical protein